MELWNSYKVNESRSIALLVVSGSTKNLFSIDCVYIYLFSIFFFNRFCPVEKCGVTPHCLYCDSLPLNRKNSFIPKQLSEVSLWKTKSSMTMNQVIRDALHYENTKVSYMLYDTKVSYTGDGYN